MDHEVLQCLLAFMDHEVLYCVWNIGRFKPMGLSGIEHLVRNVTVVSQ